MTQRDREQAKLHCDGIEPALTPGSPPHAHLILLRELLAGSHGAADHAPRTPRKRKPLVAPAGEGQP
jgi:hypothetical protein